jgi:Cu-processing system ATP-binding protein
MIALSGVSKRFGRRVILSDVDLEILPGRITGLVGANGAGKTTLLKMVLGLCRPDTGVVSVAGVDVRDGASYRGRIGYMPQLSRVPRHLTGRGLLRSVAAMRDEAVGPDLSLAEELDLRDALDRPFGTLSGGTIQKINAVIALAFRPDVLLLDEPTSGLDPTASHTIKNRILKERDNGATVLLTSHVLPELDQLANDVVFLRDAGIGWQGDVSRLKRATGHGTLEEAVVDLFAGRMRMAAA